MDPQRVSIPLIMINDCLYEGDPEVCHRIQHLMRPRSSSGRGRGRGGRLMTRQKSVVDQTQENDVDDETKTIFAQPEISVSAEKSKDLASSVEDQTVSPSQVTESNYDDVTLREKIDASSDETNNGTTGDASDDVTSCDKSKNDTSCDKTKNVMPSSPTETMTHCDNTKNNELIDKAEIITPSDGNVTICAKIENDTSKNKANILKPSGKSDNFTSCDKIEKVASSEKTENVIQGDITKDFTSCDKNENKSMENENKSMENLASINDTVIASSNDDRKRNHEANEITESDSPKGKSEDVTSFDHKATKSAASSTKALEEVVETKDKAPATATGHEDRVDAILTPSTSQTAIVDDNVASETQSDSTVRLVSSLVESSSDRSPSISERKLKKDLKSCSPDEPPLTIAVDQAPPDFSDDISLAEGEGRTTTTDELNSGAESVEEKLELIPESASLTVASRKTVSSEKEPITTVTSSRLTNEVSVTTAKRLSESKRDEGEESDHHQVVMEILNNLLEAVGKNE